MSRKVTVEEVVRKRLIQWSETFSVTCGLLLGQTNLESDYIIHIVRTDLGDFNGPMRELEEKAIADHSLTVTMMLPGGFWVLGVVVITSEELWNTERNNAKCKVILKTLRDTLSSKGIFRGISPSDELIFMQFNPVDQESLCWRFCYGENHVSIQVAEIIHQSLRRCFFEGEYAWNYVCPYKEISTTDLISNQHKYWDELKNFVNQVNESSLLLNNEHMPDEKVILKKHLDVNGRSSSDEEITYEENIGESKLKRKCNIYVCLFQPLYNYTKSLNKEQNIIREKFYAHVDSTVMEVCLAVKDDMIRSWASMLHFNIERLLESASDRKGPMKKIFVLLEHSKIPFFSYIFASEPLCLKRLHNSLDENLSLSKAEKFLLIDRDMMKDYEQSRYRDYSAVKGNRDDEEGGMNNFVYIISFVTILVAYMSIIYNGMFKNK